MEFKYCFNRLVWQNFQQHDASLCAYSTSPQSSSINGPTVFVCFILEAKSSPYELPLAPTCAHGFRLLCVLVLSRVATRCTVLRNQNIKKQQTKLWGFFRMNSKRRKIPSRMVSVWCQKAACVIILWKKHTFLLRQLLSKLAQSSVICRTRGLCWGICSHNSSFMHSLRKIKLTSRQFVININ